MFKRRRFKKTDYRQRLALLKSGKPRLVVRRSLNNFHLQIVSFDAAGDKVVMEETTKNLKKYGWLGHCGNAPAAYLAGLLIGLKARKNGINEVILDIGLQTSVKGSSIYAAALGAKDSGLEIPLGDVLLPGRINGKHIADYAARLKKENHALYKKQFSAYLKNNLEPESLQQHFENVKKKIVSEFGGGQ